MDYESDEGRKFLKTLARGEPNKPTPKMQVGKDYIPIFNHPLPASQTRYMHELSLRKLLTFPQVDQVRGAVTLQGSIFLLTQLYVTIFYFETQTRGFLRKFCYVVRLPIPLIRTDLPHYTLVILLSDPIRYMYKE